jgi:chromosome segregation ATPase
MSWNKKSNLKSSNMKFNKTWTAIAVFLGLQPETTETLTEEHLSSLNTALEEKDSIINTLNENISNKEISLQEMSNQNADLSTQIQQAESVITELNAKVESLKQVSKEAAASLQIEKEKNASSKDLSSTLSEHEDDTSTQISILKSSGYKSSLK